QENRVVMKKRSKAHAYWTIRVPARSVGLKSSRNGYLPGASIFPEASPVAPGFTKPLTAMSSSVRNCPSGPAMRRLWTTVPVFVRVIGRLLPAVVLVFDDALIAEGHLNGLPGLHVNRRR